MSTSVEQVSRLLALVPYLQAHPDADLNSTASAFGVTPRRLLADLEVNRGSLDPGTTNVNSQHLVHGGQA